MSEKISKIGKISNEEFAIKRKDFIKIGKINDPSLFQMIGFILTRASVFAGFKYKIDNANKKDIKEMILMKWKILSLEEIEYAFKLDRYSPNPVAHYQLFNANYVHKVLHNYYEWLSRMNQKNSSAPKKELPPDTEKERQAQIDIARDVFNELQEKDFYIGAWHLYNKMDIPEEYNTKDFKWKNYHKQEKIIRMESKQINALKPLESISKGSIKMRCKAYVVCEILKGIDTFDEFLSKINIAK